MLIAEIIDFLTSENIEETEISFNPEKSDIFSLGITFLECTLLLE